MTFSTGFAITARPDNEGMFQGGPPDDQTGMVYIIQPLEPATWPSEGLMSNLAENVFGHAVGDWLGRQVDPSALVPATITVRVHVEPTDGTFDDHITFSNEFVTGIRPNNGPRRVSKAGADEREVRYTIEPVDPRTSRAQGISGPRPAHLIGTALREWLATRCMLSRHMPGTVRVEIGVEPNDSGHLP